MADIDTVGFSILLLDPLEQIRDLYHCLKFQAEAVSRDTGYGIPRFRLRK